MMQPTKTISAVTLGLVAVLCTASLAASELQRGLQRSFNGQIDVAVQVLGQQATTEKAKSAKSEPSLYDKMKSGVSQFSKKVFGDDEPSSGSSGSPNQNNSNPQRNAATVTASNREFGGSGSSSIVPTAPPRNVPPKPTTADASTTPTELATLDKVNSAFVNSAPVNSVPITSQTNDGDTVGAYARLKELRARAVGDNTTSLPTIGERASLDTVTPMPNGISNVTESRPAGRINVAEVARQTQQSYGDATMLPEPEREEAFRPRGVSAFDAVGRPATAYPTAASRIDGTNMPNDYDPWLVASQAVGNTRQSDLHQPVATAPRIPESPRDVWGRPLAAPVTPIAPEPVTAVAQPANTARSINNTPRATGVRTEPAASAQPVETPQRTDDNRAILATSPLLDVETHGPQSIVVGQESTYRIRVINRGGTTAEQICFNIELPSWVDVLPPEVSSGMTDVQSNPAAEPGTKTFRWRIDRLDARGEELLVLYIVPRERKAFSLRLQYDFKRPTSVAEIDVREPRLELSLDGPSHVLWGTEEMYRLRVRNVGNGDAEGISLTLQSSSDSTDSPAAEPFRLDRLRAGEETTLEVKAWARQEDSLDINVTANGQYNLSATTTRRVVVLRPRLEVTMEAPELLFVGHTGETRVTVRNTGTAAAENVEIVANVPLGTRHVACSDGGMATPQNEVIWSVDTIPIGGEFVATMTNELKRSGDCRLEVVARESTGLAVKANTTTHVEAIAELSMKLQNPQGPIEVGAEAVYTVTVFNRGTCAAEQVEVVVAFGDNLEPLAAEGFGGKVVADRGMLVFDKISSLGAGDSVTVKARAKATTAGTHKMRAEVICEANGTHIAHEESNLFYRSQRGGTANGTSVVTPAPTKLAPSVTPAAPVVTPAPVVIAPVTPALQPLSQQPSLQRGFGEPLPPLTQLPQENKQVW